MKITSISQQARDQNRVNISVDGKYRFSLEITQVGDLGIKAGKEYNEDEISRFEAESLFGKLYVKALEFCMSRPHSSREIRDYLKRKTRATRTKQGHVKPGVPPGVADKVFERLKDKGYIDDRKFAGYWVDNRFLTKGISQRKLIFELRRKGVDQELIDEALGTAVRSDADEIRKIVAKKYSKYPDENKLMAYLARLGFGYEDIKDALEELKD